MTKKNVVQFKNNIFVADNVLVNLENAMLREGISSKSILEARASGGLFVGENGRLLIYVVKDAGRIFCANNNKIWAKNISELTLKDLAESLDDNSMSNIMTMVPEHITSNILNSAIKQELTKQTDNKAVKNIENAMLKEGITAEYIAKAKASGELKLMVGNKGGDWAICVVKDRIFIADENRSLTGAMSKQIEVELKGVHLYSAQEMMDIIPRYTTSVSEENVIGKTEKEETIKLVKDKAGQVKKAQEIVKDKAKGAADEVKDKAGQVKKAQEIVKDKAKGAADEVKDKAGQVKKAQEIVKDKAKGAADEVKDKAGQVKKAQEIVKDKAEGAVDKVKNKAEKVEEIVKDKAEGTVDEVKDKAGQVKKAQEIVKDKAEKVEEIVKDKAKGAADEVKDKAKGAADEVKDKAGQVKKAQEIVKDKAEGAVDKVKNKAEKVGEIVKDKAEGTVDEVKDKAGQVKKAQEIVEDKAEGIVSKAVGAFVKLEGIVEDKVKGAVDTFIEVAERKAEENAVEHRNGDGHLPGNVLEIFDENSPF